MIFIFYLNFLKENSFKDEKLFKIFKAINHKYLQNNFLIFENSRKMNIRSLILGIFSIVFLGPVGSPLLLLPFISIF